jgi:hypothetical protein
MGEIVFAIAIPLGMVIFCLVLFRLHAEPFALSVLAATCLMLATIWLAGILGFSLALGAWYGGAYYALPLLALGALLGWLARRSRTRRGADAG